MAAGGLTTLDNLAVLCHFHHRQKTYEGWELTRHGPSDEDPRWSFAPQPPFGQEPGLGIDKPPEPVARGVSRLVDWGTTRVRSDALSGMWTWPSFLVRWNDQWHCRSAFDTPSARADVEHQPNVFARLLR